MKQQFTCNWSQTLNILSSVHIYYTKWGLSSVFGNFKTSKEPNEKKFNTYKNSKSIKINNELKQGVEISTTTINNSDESSAEIRYIVCNRRLYIIVYLDGSYFYPR